MGSGPPGGGGVEGVGGGEGGGTGSGSPVGEGAGSSVSPVTEARGWPVPSMTGARGHAVPPVVRAAGLRSTAPVDAGPWAVPEPDSQPEPGREIESAAKQLERERERSVPVGAPAGVAPEPDGFSYAGAAEVAVDAGDLAEPGDFNRAGEAGIRRDGASGAWRERAGAALRERMPVWVQTRCGLERRSVIALGVLLLVAAVFAVQHFWVGRTQPVRAPEVVRAAAPFGDGGGGAGESEGGAAGKGPGRVPRRSERGVLRVRLVPPVPRSSWTSAARSGSPGCIGFRPVRG